MTALLSLGIAASILAKRKGDQMNRTWSGWLIAAAIAIPSIGWATTNSDKHELEQHLRDANSAIVQTDTQSSDGADAAYRAGFDVGYDKGFRKGHRSGIHYACNVIYGNGEQIAGDTWERASYDQYGQRGPDMRAIVIAIFEDGSEVRVTRSMCYRG